MSGQPVKISFIGYPRVGKTTLIELISGKKPRLNYFPTIGLDLKRISFEEHEIALWDLAGHKNFLPMWSQFITGSILIFVITDSTPQNVLQSKMIIEWLKRKDSFNILAIANKQDLEGAMSADRVANVLDVPTYPLVAVEPSERGDFLQLLRKLLSKLFR